MFQVWFSMRPPMDPLSLPEVEASVFPLPAETAKWDLNIELTRHGEGYEVSLEWAIDLFDRQTIEAWAAGYVDVLARLCLDPGETCAALADSARVGPQATAHQARLWFVDRFENGVLYPAAPTYYNMCAWIDLDVVPDPGRLRAALDELSLRHAALRTSFDGAADRPMARVQDASARIPVEWIDDDRAPVERIVDETLRPFRPTDAPLARSIVLRLPGGRARLAIAAHHIVVDARSLRVLLVELGELIEGRPLAQATVLEPAPPRRRDDDVAYWRARLQGIRPLLIPTDRRRPAVHTFTTGRASIDLPPGTLAALDGSAQAAGLERKDLLRAAFVAVLHLLSGQDDIVHGETMVPDKATAVGPAESSGHPQALSMGGR